MNAVNSPKKAAAKKAAKKHTPEHDQQRHAKDVRRSYEHLGRVELLSSLVEGNHIASVHELVAISREFLAAKHAKDGADLLRAAEHLCFGLALTPRTADQSVNKDLEAAIQEEYRHLQDKAMDHASENKMPANVQTIYTFMTKEAASAMKAKNYRCAIELARGAEALAHVADNIKTLPAGQNSKLLT